MVYRMGMHPQKVLDTLGASPRRLWGQNFMTSPHWAKRLVECLLEGEGQQEIWEIGPGLGALTSVVVKLAKANIRLFEIDPKYAEWMRGKYPDIEVIEGDFLDVPLSQIGPRPRSVAVLSNLPYNAGSAILFRLIEHRTWFTKLVLTFQREFGERLLASPSHADYGSISILVQSVFKMKKLGVIGPGAFYPPPEIDSMAIEFVPHQNETPGMYHALNSVVKASFAHRRKQLKKNLGEIFPKDEIERQLIEWGLPVAARPEELSVEQYVQLARQICLS